MRVLITGAFGFLGGRLAAPLRERGFEVVLSGRRSGPVSERLRGLEVRNADVLDPEACARAVQGMDGVVHLASLDENEASENPALALAVSGEGTRILLGAARAAGVRRVLFLSTIHVYGPSAPNELDEHTLTQAAHPYAIAHLAGECFCRQVNLQTDAVRAIIIRLSNGYGCPVDVNVDRWSLAHNDFCRQAALTYRIVLRSDGLQHRDLVWVEDVAQAMALLLEAPPEQLGDGVFHVGGRNSVSMIELAERVRVQAERMLGRPVAIERKKPARAGQDPIHFSIARISALGFVPQDRVDEETDRIIRMILEARA